MPRHLADQPIKKYYMTSGMINNIKIKGNNMVNSPTGLQPPPPREDLLRFGFGAKYLFKIALRSKCSPGGTLGGDYSIIDNSR